MKIAIILYFAIKTHSILALYQFNDTPEVAEFRRGNRIFAGKLYKEIIKNKKGNFIASPFSVEVILALTNEGAAGKTSEELINGLNLPTNKQTTQKAFVSILSQLQSSDEDLKLVSANKIYVAEDAKLKSNFTEVAKNTYKAGVENVDFSSEKQTAKTINLWVQEQTYNKIQNIIKPEHICQETKLILVNALYFSGKWLNTFDIEETHKEKFYSTKEDVQQIDMMYQNDYFKYYENEKLNTKFVELPYRGGNASLVLVLPNELDGLLKLENHIEKLLEPQPLNDYENLDLKVPKFETESEIEMKSILEVLGVKKLFSRKADLSGLFSNSEEMYVDKVVQKAFIKLNEDGSEAAATTGVKIGNRIGPDYSIPVYADHPFLYYIQDNGIILFIGSVKTK